MQADGVINKDGGTHDVPYFLWMSLSNCETRHFNIIISTGGMPSAVSRPLIRSSISSFSFAGIRIHLVQLGWASESCLASSLVINFNGQLYSE